MLKNDQGFYLYDRVKIKEAIECGEEIADLIARARKSGMLRITLGAALRHLHFTYAVGWEGLVDMANQILAASTQIFQRREKIHSWSGKRQQQDDELIEK